MAGAFLVAPILDPISTFPFVGPMVVLSAPDSIVWAPLPKMEIEGTKTVHSLPTNIDTSALATAQEKCSSQPKVCTADRS